MARVYSRKKGKHGSKKPAKKTAPQIGMILRDVYGIPNAFALCNKSISAVLKEKNLSAEVPEDMISLFKKVAALRKHIEANKHDQTSKRGLLLTQSKINRLTKYYKRTGRIPENWKFDATRSGFFTQGVEKNKMAKQ